MTFARLGIAFTAFTTFTALASGARCSFAFDRRSSFLAGGQLSLHGLGALQCDGTVGLATFAASIATFAFPRPTALAWLTTLAWLACLGILTRLGVAFAAAAFAASFATPSATALLAITSAAAFAPALLAIARAALLAVASAAAFSSRRLGRFDRDGAGRGRRWRRRRSACAAAE